MQIFSILSTWKGKDRHNMDTRHGTHTQLILATIGIAIASYLRNAHSGYKLNQCQYLSQIYNNTYAIAYLIGI